MFRKTTFLALAFLAIPALAGAPEEAAHVFVLHGIPGDDADPTFPVDVLVDDTLCALEGLTFGELFGPVPFEPRSYNLKISAANLDTPCANAALLEADVLFEAGENATVAAYLTEAGDPVVGKFVNDLSPVLPGTARIQLHHLAAAPAVDVALVRPVDDADDDDDDVETGDDEVTDKRRPADKPVPAPVFADLANGEQASALVRPGGWDATVYPAGGMDPVAGPLSLKARPFSVTLLYAIGSLDGGSLTVVGKEVPLKVRRGPRPPNPDETATHGRRNAEGPQFLLRNK